MRYGNEKPVNKTASIVTQKGFEYIPKKVILTLESKNPLPIMEPRKQEKMQPNFIDLKGHSFARFKVIGRYALGKGWVCRCACGVYCVRSRKAILNKENTQDRCEECRHLAYLKRDDYYRRTRKDADIRDY